MAVIDTVARAGALALLTLVALVLVRDRPRAFISWTTVGLCCAVAGYLVISSPDYASPGLVDSFLRAAALGAPAIFWVFTRAFFGDDDRLTGWHAGVLVAVVAVGFARPAPWAQALYYGGSLAVVGLALGQVVRELRHDLIESRRSMRPVFAAVVGVEIVVVLGVELWLGGAPASRAVETIKSVGALALALGFAAWLLAPRRDLLAVTTLALVSVDDPVSEADVDARFRERLLALVQSEQLYRQEGLTIRALALKLDVPEYRLRRIINQQLGHRNFNAFLNDLRTAEACRLLADPAHERLPIFNLALDLGYGSLGPFNRAFRARTGQTPTAYRRAHLESSTAGRESPVES
jgi:AraC-like DNA-binding protein